MKRRDILVKYRDMTSKELDGTLNDLKNELFNLRFQLATGQLENPLKLKSVKKDIARVNSILRERELQA
jgi:large subunit ribosomal protein L29